MKIIADTPLFVDENLIRTEKRARKFVEEFEAFLTSVYSAVFDFKYEG